MQAATRKIFVIISRQHNIGMELGYDTCFVRGSVIGSNRIKCTVIGTDE
jgi:hypothetical protein